MQACSDTQHTSLDSVERIRWRRIGLLAALSMAMGYLESFVPIPIPGVKLGLANAPVLVALMEGDAAGACWVALVKVLATGLLFGNPLTMAYSLVGTTLALILMLPLAQLPTMRIEMTSIVGALAHEAGQLLVAQALLGTPLVWYSAPLLGVAGCATGAFCGLVARRVQNVLASAQAQVQVQVCSPTHADDVGVSATALSVLLDDRPHAVRSHRTTAILVSYLALVTWVMHARDLRGMALGTVLTALACLCARVGPTLLSRALLPVLPIALVTLVAQVASSSQTPALVQVAGVGVSTEALARTGLMLGRLVCVSAASVALVRILGRDELAATARRMLAPLESMGMKTAGPELALATTLQAAPLLAGEIAREAGFRELVSPRFWEDRLTQLVVLMEQDVGD